VILARIAWIFICLWEPPPVDTVDQRMQAFVTWYGEVPLEAKRLEDFEARRHAHEWVRRTLGKGIAAMYVVGYQLNERWWTLFFDRIEGWAPEGAETWCIEAYNSAGKSWIEEYYYWPAERRWRHPLYVEKGDDYGRHIMAGTIPR
jgi:hypothetical protein